MDTYFWVNAHTLNRIFRFGAYATFEQASEILIEHLPNLLRAEGVPDSDVLATTITEEYVSGKSWTVVIVRSND